MNVDLISKSLAFESILNNPNQIITLDANVLIPPDRSKYATISFSFDKFKSIWLEPIFSAFPNLAIHEAVYDELVLPSVRNYVDSLINNSPSKLSIHRDSLLSSEEYVLRNTIEEKIYPLTKYDPLLDNKDDRGEVKSLSYIAVKEMIYFAAHDSNAIQLIEMSESQSTGLDNVQAIKIYELIFYLHKHGSSTSKGLKMLYKYQYYLTKHEKTTNPEWGEFIKDMEVLYYNCYFSTSKYTHL